MKIGQTQRLPTTGTLLAPGRSLRPWHLLERWVPGKERPVLGSQEGLGDTGKASWPPRGSGFLICKTEVMFLICKTEVMFEA